MAVRGVVRPWLVLAPAGALATCLLPAPPAAAQDLPPPPPGPRNADRRGVLVDPADPSFRGAALGDLNDFVTDTAGNERILMAVGGRSQPVWLRYPGFELRADNAVIWGDRERLDQAISNQRSVDLENREDLLGGVFHAVYAEGDVFVRRDAQVFHADRLLLDFQRHQAYVVNAHLQGRAPGAQDQDVPLILRAAVLRGVGRDKYRAEDAQLTSCTYANPHLSFDTSWVTVDYSKAQPEFETGWWPRLRADTWFGKAIPLIPLPKLGGTLGTHPIQTLEFSRSNRFGTTLGAGFGGRFDRADGTTWGTWQLAPRYRTRRGPGLGLEFDHEAIPDKPRGRQDRLELSGEYQRDRQDEDRFSDRPFDGEVGGDSDPDRGHVDLRWRRWLDSDAERSVLGDGWRLDGQASWYSDRGYLPEYDNEVVLREPQQETYADVSRRWGDQAFSLFASRRLADETSALVRRPSDLFVTDYAVGTDYLPSATWHLVNRPLVPYEATRFAPVNVSVEASVANVERRYDDVAADAFRDLVGGWRSRRLLREDVEARVTTPFELGPVNVTPAFGGSVYHVSDANGFANAGTSDARDDEGRHALFVGLRAGSEVHRTFDAQSELLDIDGLRHVASFDAQWFDRFRVSDENALEFQQNDLHDRLVEQDVLSFRLRNRLQTKREGEVVDWFDYEARFLWYVNGTDAAPPTFLGLREEFATPLERLDFPGEDKYLGRTRDGSAFHQHRARLETLRNVWLVGEADYDMTASQMETTAAGVRWFLDHRFSVYVGRRTIHEDSSIWTVRGDYRLSDKWGFTGEFQQDTRSDHGLRTRLGLYRRSHDFTFVVEFESERLLDETGVSFLIYPHDWLVKKGDPFSRRRPLDFEALRWYR